MAVKEAIAKEYKYKDVEIWNKRGKLHEGDKLEGYYIAKEEFETKFGPAASFIIQKADGSLMKVMGQTDIKAKMATIPLYCHVWFEYVGLIETDRGSKKAYKINYDDEDNADVNEVEPENA